MHQSIIKQDMDEHNSWTHSGKTSKDDVQNAVLAPHPRKRDIAWRDTMILFIFHIGAIYGIYLYFTKAKWQTCVFAYISHVAAAVGVTAGAHRLWSHKAYKANLPLRIILLWFFTKSFLYSVIWWVRTHRMHHKHCDTDADPHNASRGFFFSHIGWTMIRKHPEVSAHRVDLSDVLEDPLLRFQLKYYWFLLLPACFIVPTYIPVLWGEEVYIAFYTCVCLRLVMTWHSMFLINSAAHMWGTRPYDKNMRPAETKTVAFLAAGDGFHNFHHSFPWDYRLAEHGGYFLNHGKLFIDMMSVIGWAYDLKTVSNELIEQRVKRTGDGTHPVWGWDDPDMPLGDKISSNIY